MTNVRPAPILARLATLASILLVSLQAIGGEHAPSPDAPVALDSPPDPTAATEIMPDATPELTVDGVRVSPTEATDPMALWEEAENAYSNRSWEQALAIFRRIKEHTDHAADSEEGRWLRFRIAETAARSALSAGQRDPTRAETALVELQDLLRELERIQGPKPQMYAEVQESMGDIVSQTESPHSGWNHYRIALDWWAGSKQLHEARHRYLAIVWKAGSPREGWHGPYQRVRSQVPLEILENAARIAQSDADRARAHFLVARSLEVRGDDSSRLRVANEYEAAIRLGRGQPWHDDALFALAQWNERAGRLHFDENGNLVSQADFESAVGIYQTLLQQYREGESRYWRQARDRIDNITQPQLGVVVPHHYLPDSEPRIRLNWRNLSRIELQIHKLDPASLPIEAGTSTHRSWEWMQAIDVSGMEPLRTVAAEKRPESAHYPVEDEVRLAPISGSGLYLITARSGKHRARDLLMVTDTVAVMQHAGPDVTVFFADAHSGKPIPEARVTLWEIRDQRRQGARWLSHEGTTGTDGLARFTLDSHERGRGTLAVAHRENRIALATGHAHYNESGESWNWRVYAYADRPAYRPDETAHWKVVLRQYNGESYRTPTDTRARYRILDPRGAVVDEGPLVPNAYGTAWGDLPISTEWALGLYQLQVIGPGERYLGSSQLFRVEEYRLPEFEVAVDLAEGADGRPGIYRIGDRVEGEVRAEYYFGGPVADGSVEIIVRRRPYFHTFLPHREFPWLHPTQELPHSAAWGRPQRWDGGFSGGSAGQEVARFDLTTDMTGRARFAFETGNDTGQDFTFSVEARVIDASRREIVTTRDIRVTRLGYAVHLDTGRRIYSPDERVRIAVRAEDANGRGVSVEGQIRLTRERWEEIWIDRRGKVISGAELREIRAKSGGWLSFGPNPRDYRLEREGYVTEEVDAVTVTTDDDGQAEYAFTVPDEGYYRIAWVSRDQSGRPVKADTAIWSSSGTAEEIGYRSGDLTIIVDRESFRAGERAPVMLTAPTGNRHVLLTVGAETILSTRVVHLEGSTKLIHLDIDESYIPNAYLEANMVSALELHRDQAEIVVPPTGQFLDIAIEANADGYEPGERGEMTIIVTDHNGQPVETELSLALVDDAVFAIQPELAPDIREFFFGNRRGYHIQTTSTLEMKPFFRLEDAEPDRRFKDGGGGDDAVFELSAFSVSQAESANVRTQAPMAMAATRVDMAANATVEEAPAPRLRTDFRSTVFWQPDIVTDADGRATVPVTYPDSLTRWRAVSRGVAQGDRFGWGKTTTQTRLPLIARLQAPRFFVNRDRSMITGVFNNNTSDVLDVEAGLAIEGPLELAGPGTRIVAINPGEQARIDWPVTAVGDGDVTLRLSARSGRYGDAVEKSIPVHEHGIEQFLGHSGKARSDRVEINLELPADRRAESTRATVTVAPSIATVLLDALPYLIEYPYGCTEQTVSRFVPAVVVSKALADLGVKRDLIGRGLFGGLDPETVPDALSKKSHSLDQLDEVVAAGLKRLADFQHADGGWGWWKEGPSDLYMSAYVVWSLTLAEQAGVNPDGAMLDRGRDFLSRTLVEAEVAFDLQAWMLHALAARYAADSKANPSRTEAQAFLNLMRNRDQLGAYTRALLAVSANHFGFDEDSALLIENLRNGVQRDDRPDTSILLGDPGAAAPEVMPTAHWGTSGVFWRWSDGAVESTAFSLMALLAADPDNALVEPAMNWLVKNRRGSQWSNTRDSAIAVLALTQYLRQSGELENALAYRILLNGEPVRAINPQGDPGQSIIPQQISLPANQLRDGSNRVVIERTNGSGSALYFSVHAEFFDQSDPVEAAGNEIFVHRSYFHLKPTPTLLKGFAEEKQVLRDGDAIQSGDRIEVVLRVETKNDLTYLLFEDNKPAGFESVRIRSGEPTYARAVRESRLLDDELAAGDAAPWLDARDRFIGRQHWVYEELRDRHTALFVDRMPQGFWEIRYRLRAETPGTFHALPLTGEAMYVPDIRANSQEIRIGVTAGE